MWIQKNLGFIVSNKTEMGREQEGVIAFQLFLPPKKTWIFSQYFMLLWTWYSSSKKKKLSIHSFVIRVKWTIYFQFMCCKKLEIMWPDQNLQYINQTEVEYYTLTFTFPNQQKNNCERRLIIQMLRKPKKWCD